MPVVPTGTKYSNSFRIRKKGRSRSFIADRRSLPEFFDTSAISSDSALERNPSDSSERETHPVIIISTCVAIVISGLPRF